MMKRMMDNLQVTSVTDEEILNIYKAAKKEVKHRYQAEAGEQSSSNIRKFINIFKSVKRKAGAEDTSEDATLSAEVERLRVQLDAAETTEMEASAEVARLRVQLDSAQTAGMEVEVAREEVARLGQQLNSVELDPAAQRREADRLRKAAERAKKKEADREATAQRMEAYREAAAQRVDADRETAAQRVEADREAAAQRREADRLRKSAARANRA